MRTIRLPDVDWNEVGGHSVSFPVMVGWPELQLTEEQMLANAVHLAWDLPGPEPFPDPSLIEVVVPVPAAVMRERQARRDSEQH